MLVLRQGVAQFWASKAVKNNDSSYSINDIMGPDEYHGPVNNSVYCNVIAQVEVIEMPKIFLFLSLC